MPLDLESLKSAVAQKWRGFAQNLPEAAKRLGVTSAYGLLVSATFLPLLQAYTTDATPTILALGSIASGVGTNLLAALIEKALKKNLAPPELEKLAKEDSEIQMALDALVSRTESLRAAQAALGASWDAFSTRLHEELQGLSNSPNSLAILTGRTVIRDANVAAPINIIVQSGGQLIINGNLLQLQDQNQPRISGKNIAFGNEQ